MTVLRPLLFLLVLLGALAPPVRAEEVAFLSSDGRVAEHNSALGIALHGYGVAVRSLPFEAGDSPLGRAALAQHFLRDHSLAAVLWVEPEVPARVRVLHGASDHPLEAPLPRSFDQIEPNVFASVASSVVLEALGRMPSSPYVPAREPVAPESPALVAPPAPERPGEAELPRRFFLRVAGTAGFGHLRAGQAMETNPPGSLAVDAANAFTTDGNAGAEAVLESQGYNCETRKLPGGALAFSDCKSVLANGGFAFVPALDLAVGARLSPRVSLAATGRLGLPGVGVVLGVQAEVLLTRAQAKGGWLALAGGGGAGRIHVALPRPASSTLEDAPRITSGLANLRMGLLAGYRFHPNVGLTFALTAHYMFPHPLVLIDQTVGVEVRM